MSCTKANLFYRAQANAALPSIDPQPVAQTTKDITQFAQIPRIRKPGLDLPVDFRIVRQMPFSSGKRELLFVSRSTGAEQVYLTSLPDADRFELFGVEFRNVASLDLRPLLVGKNIQIDTAEAESKLKEFKILFKDNLVSKVVLGDGTMAELTGSQAVIKSPKGTELERIPLPSIRTSIENPVIAQLNEKTKSSSSNGNNSVRVFENSNSDVRISQAGSPACQAGTSSYLKNSSQQMSQLGEQLAGNSSVNSILLGGALKYGDTSLQNSGISKEISETVCKPPIQCNEQVISGGSEIRTDLFQVPQGSDRKVSLEYEFFQIPDRLEMDFDGKQVTAIGPTSGRSTQSFSFPNDAKYVGVKLTGNQEIKTTEWWYKVSCSVEEIKDARIKITNIQDGQLISMTDKNLVKPQSLDNENEPITQYLVVEGTAIKTKTVSVNGRNINVVNDRWKIDLPITSLGKLSITAKGDDTPLASWLNFSEISPQLLATSKLSNFSLPHYSVAQAKPNPNTVNINVYIYKVNIITPINDWQKFSIEGSPLVMPRIEAKAKIDGLSGSQIPHNPQWNWTLTLGGKQRQRGGYKKYSRNFNGNSTGENSWIPHFQEIIGGWGKLIVEVQIDGRNVKSKPRWIDIQGANPSTQEVLSYIDTNGKEDKEIIKKILCHESDTTSTGQRFNHFNPNPDTREGIDDRIPKDKQVSGFALRPRFGAPPAGIGVAQVDPADFPAQHWNWQANVSQAIELYYEKARSAAQLAERERSRLSRERDQALEFMRRRDIRSDNVPPISVPELTEQQLRREKIRRYNGNRHHHFDARYGVSQVDATLRISLIGTQTWLDNQAGVWEDDDGLRKRFNVNVYRTWNPGPPERQGYVDAVEKCNP